MARSTSASVTIRQAFNLDEMISEDLEQPRTVAQAIKSQHRRRIDGKMDMDSAV